MWSPAREVLEGGHICLRGALGRQRYSEQGGAISMVSKTLGELQGGNYGSRKMRPKPGERDHQEATALRWGG